MFFDSDKKDETDESGDARKATVVKPEKKGFDNNEKITRRVDAQKIEELAAKEKKTDLQKNPNQTPPPGMKKVSTKIATSAYDEDEDENEVVFIKHTFQQMEPNDNSIINSLNDKESRALQEKATLKTIQNLQNAEKLGALNISQKMASQAGIGNIDKKTLNKDMLDATYDKNKVAKTIGKSVSKKYKINAKKIKKDDYKDVLSGVKAIRDLGGKVEGMDVKKVNEAGKNKNNRKKVAEIIYDNAKNSEKKNFEKKIKRDEARKIYEKTGRMKSNNLSKNQVKEKAVERIQEDNYKNYQNYANQKDKNR